MTTGERTYVTKVLEHRVAEDVNFPHQQRTVIRLLARLHVLQPRLELLELRHEQRVLFDITRESAFAEFLLPFGEEEGLLHLMVVVNGVDLQATFG